MEPPGVILISALFPPARAGLADHTFRLAQELGGQRRVTVLTGAGPAEPIRPGLVVPRVRDWRDAREIAGHLADLPSRDPILWQYVPHMYGRGGANRAIPRTMAALRRLGRRQIVLAHEIAGPYHRWPHQWWYALNQRWQWQAILAQASQVGISTEAWLEEWQARRPRAARRLFLAPSPSTVPVLTLPPGSAALWRAQQGWGERTRVLAYFGSLGPARHFDRVWRAWQEAQAPGLPAGLVAVGDRPDMTPPPALAELYRPLGFQSLPEVSRALQAADVLALPFIDGVSERRTTFMAGLAHGLATVGTVGPNTGPTLRQARFYAPCPCEDPARFVRAILELLNDPPARLALGAAAREAYTRAYDWPRLLATLSPRLDPEGTPG